MPTLPPPVLAHVMEFAVNEFTQELAPLERQLPLRDLKDVALVCKNTLNSVRSLVSSFRATTMTLALENAATTEDIEALYHNVETHGASVSDLRIILNEGNWNTKSIRPGHLENLEIRWNTLFGFLAGLKRLDLSRIPLLSRHTVDILEAAETHCRNMEFLILPRKGDTNPGVHSVSIDKVMTALYATMERWHSTGGLKQLTVPSRNETNHYRESTQFIENVTKFCPKIEYLDGYQKVISYADVHCPEMWTISLETWRAFNATCTNLRSFHWFVVPFADPFFRVFGEYVKPRLKSLSLSANVNWKYDQYLRECSESIGTETAGTINPPGYGVSTSEARAVLKACPALTSLSIDIDYIQNNNPQTQYISTAVYGDKFWETAAEYCPLLESVDMTDASIYQNFNIQCVNDLSDRTLTALAKLKYLTSVEFCAARLTGNGIFEWLCGVSKFEDSVGPERMLGVRIGGHKRSGFRLPRFYAEIMELLRLLSEIDEESLEAASCRTKPLLYITNPFQSKVSRVWSAFYMRDKLRPVLEAVKAKHPSLRVNVALLGRDGDKFNRIDTLTLDWRVKESKRKNELFFDYIEEQAERDTYLDAARYEIISDDEGGSDEDDRERELQSAILTGFNHEYDADL
ncbi:hypothetical protein PPTG_06621 [Phytophthora nicotianae INRA-310]|uniref:Uncharacterized protein n=2 Tax=Phytophthora nicotianae TaxID=4792 RepID=W2QSV8_PHYN3|nr:hypothetical protein PPTG_06621 [Phytophthora nicotianae INRA-310]ETN15345.1 hypothetical protein PPTG_06621 [Phytophthora nicotianae INRA-310]